MFPNFINLAAIFDT